MIAELLCAEGARAEPDTLENLVTIIFKNFGCHVTVHAKVRMSVRQVPYLEIMGVAPLP